jgi:hypothetical protein
VPTLVDGLLGQLAEMLGVRGYFADGGFAKLVRDHRIVAIFDGSTAVNRSTLISQFSVLSRAYQRRRPAPAGLAAAAGLGEPLDELSVDGLALLSHAGCSVVQAMPDAVDRLRGLVGGGEAAGECLRLADQLVAHTSEVAAGLAAYRPAREVPAEAFVLAERYELCFAGAACLLLWLHNRTLLSETWLRACLTQIVTLLGGRPEAADLSTMEDLADAAADRRLVLVLVLVPGAGAA